MTAVPPPPSTTARPMAVADTECYPNYWLLKLRPKGGSHVYSFRLNAGESFSVEEAARIRLLFDAFCVVTFNGNYYDVAMITAALAGYSAEQLKWLNDRIIVEKAKPWELGLPDWKPSDHIDVMQVIPGAGGQKYKAGIIHYRTMRDLPYDPSTPLDAQQVANVDQYCENDLGQLAALADAVRSQIKLREDLGQRYGIDLRSKSDAQVAEAVLKVLCEQALGHPIYKKRIHEIDWNYRFRYDVPDYVAYRLPQLQRALELVKNAVFRIQPPSGYRADDEKGKCVIMPPELEGLAIVIGGSTYKLGVGGLHSQEKGVCHEADADTVLRDYDVASYYPSLILNSGAWPEAMGPAFLSEYAAIKAERLEAKRHKKDYPKDSPEYAAADTRDSGGKIMLNGTFGKTGSPHSILWAPKMMVQTTVTGQLSLLMLIEWHEHYGIPVVSANTDGIVVKCPRHLLATSEALVKEWERRTGLEMETTEYRGIYSQGVNSYVAVKTDGSIKRKGEFAKADLIMKKAPDCEICADAVAEFLANGTPLAYTISMCRDIRKFVTIRNVAGGAIKLWGEGPRKGVRVSDMLPVLLANGWHKDGRKWRKGDTICDPTTAYHSCFEQQIPEHLGKVIRWYYGTKSPGPIVYASNGNTVSLSYGAKPCMTLPDEFPDDIDYQCYVDKAETMLRSTGYYTLK